MFTSRRPGPPATARPSLIAPYSILAAAGLALWACTDPGGGGGPGGPCGEPASNGTVAFAFSSQSFTATCFSAVNDGGSIGLTSLAPAAGQTAAVMQLDLRFRDPFRNVCPWFPGASSALSGGCVALTAQLQTGDAIQQTAVAGDGRGAGSLTVSDWGTGPGQLVSFIFSVDAALSSTADPDGGTSTVFAAGSASTLVH